jgi:kexin
VGVAHGAGVAGIRILSASISDADEASSLNYGYQTNDIYSCSWGPPDDGKSMEAPGRLIVKAMINGVQNGRQGKGSIFVFASGNGGAVDDQCNFDGYTNSLMSITVGAIDRKGLHPFYSEACSANMVVTYSSGSGDNIVSLSCASVDAFLKTDRDALPQHTTDVGKNTCTDRHGGTSAAAPIAAGIFALVLEVRPELTWRDMQHLCVRTAVQINPNDPDWQMTASGRWYNHKYGFGKLDAWAIVEAAKTWDLVKPQAWWQSPIAFADPQGSREGLPMTPEGATAEIVVTANDLKTANLEKLEHVTITVQAEHERRGNIEVELVSPRGMKSILARPRRFDEDPNGMPGWVFMSVKHWCVHIVVYDFGCCADLLVTLQGRGSRRNLDAACSGSPEQRQTRHVPGLLARALGLVYRSGAGQTLPAACRGRGRRI